MRLNSRSLATFICIMAVTASGCVTKSESTSSVKRVIDRTPGVDASPDWTKGGSKKFQAPGDRVGFKGFLTMDADSRPDACTHAAGVEAKGRLATMIASSILDSSGISGDDKTLVYNRLTASIAKQRLAGVETGEEYWQLIEVDDGEKKTRRLECWATVTISSKVLERVLNLAIAEITKDPTLKKHEDRLEKAEDALLEDELKR